MSHINSHRYMYTSVYHKASALAGWEVSFLNFFLFNGLVQSREFTFCHISILVLSILQSSVDKFFFETALCSPGWSRTLCIGGWLYSWSSCLYLLTAGITGTHTMPDLFSDGAWTQGLLSVVCLWSPSLVQPKIFTWQYSSCGMFGEFLYQMNKRVVELFLLQTWDVSRSPRVSIA